jgi:hypothetical protein
VVSGAALYLDTSVALRATLEHGTTLALERRIAAAPVLVTSRLALVEVARARVRVRLQGGVLESRLADARRGLDALWQRCELWELSPRSATWQRSSPPTRCCALWMRSTWRLFSWPGGGSKASSC